MDNTENLSQKNINQKSLVKEQVQKIEDKIEKGKKEGVINENSLKDKKTKEDIDTNNKLDVNQKIIEPNVDKTKTEPVNIDIKKNADNILKKTDTKQEPEQQKNINLPKNESSHKSIIPNKDEIVIPFKKDKYYFFILDDTELSVSILGLANKYNLNFSHHTCGEKNQLPYHRVLEAIRNNGTIVYMSEKNISYTEEMENNHEYRKSLLEKNTEPISVIVSLILKNPSSSVKFIYLSNNNVFYGDKGNYTPYSEIKPKNLYGMSKAISELTTQMLPNYLIIRPSYLTSETFSEIEAYSDIIRDWLTVEDIKDKLFNIIVSNKSGIINLSGKRKTLSRLYQENIDINWRNKIRASQDIINILPIDLSMKK